MFNFRFHGKLKFQISNAVTGGAEIAGLDNDGRIIMGGHA